MDCYEVEPHIHPAIVLRHALSDVIHPPKLILRPHHAMKFVERPQLLKYFSPLMVSSGIFLFIAHTLEGGSTTREFGLQQVVRRKSPS